MIKKFLNNQILDTEFIARTLCCQWRMKGSYDIISMANELSTIKLNYEKKRMMENTKGPWSVAQRYLLWKTREKFFDLLKLLSRRLQYRYHDHIYREP